MNEEEYEHKQAVALRLGRVPGIKIAAAFDKTTALGFDLLARYQNGPVLLLAIGGQGRSRLSAVERWARKAYGEYWYWVESFEDALRVFGLDTERSPF